MKSLYQRTFDQLHLSEEKAAALRAALVSHHTDLEVKYMKHTKFFSRPVRVLVAALMVCALSVTAFAYGGRIVTDVYRLMSGGSIEQGIDENNSAYSSGSMDTSDLTAPVELGADGRLYLVANGENLDITDLCSYTTPYIYEFSGDDGLRHVFVVGGALDAIGWSEFIWDENGMPVGGNTNFGTSAGRSDAPWLDAAMSTLGLPW